MQDSKTREEWLQNLPHSVSISIAARAAARAIPMLGSLTIGPTNLSKDQILKTIIYVFSASSFAWSASKYKKHANDFEKIEQESFINVLKTQIDISELSKFTGNIGAKLSTNAAKCAISVYIRKENIYQLNSILQTKTNAIINNKDIEYIGEKNTDIEKIINAEKLVSQKLWIDGIPRPYDSMWSNLKGFLPKTQHWDVWTRWYEDRLEGRQANEELELFRTLQPKEFWQQEPAVINKAIWDKEQEILARQKTVPKTPASPPDIPPQKPAAIEPVWKSEVLTLPKTPALAELNVDIPASFQALRRQIEKLADATEKEHNCVDPRVVVYLRELSSSIPSSAPPLDVLFDLCHEYETLESHAAEVREAWPNLLATRYMTMMLAFERTFRQFIEWKNFKSNAAQDGLTPEQIAATQTAIGALGQSLKEETTHSHHIDKELVNRLIEQNEKLTERIESVATHAISSHADVAKAAITSQAEIARSHGESGNNTIKAIAEMALSRNPQTFPSAQKDDAGLLDKIKDSAKKKVADSVAKWALDWLSKFLKEGMAKYGVDSAETVGFWLMNNLPLMFGWLQHILPYLN